MTLLPHHHQAKVRELEEKCRNQSEQFNLLSKELEKFRLQAGKFDILSTEPLNLCESPGSPSKTLSQLLNGLAAPIGKGMCRILLMLSANPFIMPTLTKVLCSLISVSFLSCEKCRQRSLRSRASDLICIKRASPWQSLFSAFDLNTQMLHLL